MRAVVIEKPGGPGVLKIAERPVPEPQDGQAVVRVAAAGVNFMDIYLRQGVADYRPQRFPATPGGEGAGTITALAADVADLSVGDRVAWADVPGSYAEQVAVPADRLVPVPPDVDLTAAAAVMFQGITAHYLCYSTYPVREGDVVVVHAAAGGVGLLLTQMVKQRGGVVVATTSSGEKRDLARGAGADHGVGYGEFRATVARVTGGAGTHVVYDGVGKATFDESLASLRARGMMVFYGAASGPVPPFDVQRLSGGPWALGSGSLYLTRPSIAHYISDRDELLWRAQDLFGWLATDHLKVRIGGTYPLADAAQVHEDLASRRTTGKLLLVP